jgi:GIY-YIG catalytic domain
MQLQFNDLLDSEGIDRKTVLVLRHRPTEPKLRRQLPWLAAEHPDMFNAYQQTQGPKLESAFKKARYVASFIAYESNKALFIGLYKRGDWRTLQPKDFKTVPGKEELSQRYGENWSRQPETVFDLNLQPFYERWKGKLIIEWPGAQISWWRWSARNVLPVYAVLEQSFLDEEMPSWENLVLTWDELQVLPSNWQDALKHWRGVYLIFDQKDGKFYVGSAYGHENMLGRWQNYRATGHGGNKELRRRNLPSTFQFSILQRVSPDMPPEEVIQVETTWKKRLHTYVPVGMNEN